MTIISQPSPNHDSRDGAEIDMLLLHYTGMKTGAEALERLCDPAAKVSAHYAIEENGTIFQLVEEKGRAWHAGIASWRGHANINARSIGIELVNPGHEWGYRPFPPAQIHALVGLCQGILARHDIPPRNVIGHSDVAPARKQDPGERFPWARLAEQGIGLYPKTSQAPCSQPPFQRETLKRYGYSCEQSTDTQLISAFQRHFRPEKVNGHWDSTCQARLDWLLENCA